MFRRLIVIILLWSGSAYGAAITSKVVGTTDAPALASVATNWVGDVAPVDGDTVTIASGAVILQDVNRTYGSNAAAVGHAVTINGTNSTTYGVFRVADGVTLTLRGYDLTNNTLMRVNQYAIFEPLPGATIVGDVAGNYTSFIDNRGIINAIGTLAKPITLTSPIGAYSWNNSITGEVVSGSGWKYKPASNIATRPINNRWVANAAGTGLGTVGDSSLSFSAKTPATILVTEVASEAAVDSVGEYYVDYDSGLIYFYHNKADGDPSFTKAYKYMALTKGWGISSVQNTTYNEAKFEYCNFYYMGTTAGADSRAVNVRYKKSTSVAANRLFSFKNNTVRFVSKVIGIKDCDGTALDPLLIANNDFGASPNDETYGFSITAYRANNSYFKIDSNLFRYTYALVTFEYGTFSDMVGFIITNNTFYSAYGVASGRMSGGLIANNTINSFGSAGDTRMFQVEGTDGTRVTIRDNNILYPARAIHYGSFSDIHNNRIVYSLHHGAVGPIMNDTKVESVIIRNNIFVGEVVGTYGYDDSTSVETGYNYRKWLDDIQVYNNTMVGNANGIFGFGDIQDNGTYTLLTRVQAYNNLGMLNNAGGIAFRRKTDTTTSLVRAHVTRFDYNMDYNFTTRYGTGLTRQGAFAGITNVAGVSLFSPSFSTKTGGTLALAHTSGTNRTLGWGAGTPVQIVLDSGTATSGANTSINGITGVYSGTLTDSAKTWTTTKNDPACPANQWLLVTGGTGTGQIRAITNNTATVLTVAPAWTTVPDATSTYAIIKAEVTLTDGAESVQAGIYLPDLPTSSQTDTGISFADHSITGQNPLLSNSNGLTFADMALSAGSPAINAGYGGVDIGAIDYVEQSSPNGTQRKRNYGFSFGW